MAKMIKNPTVDELLDYLVENRRDVAVYVDIMPLGHGERRWVQVTVRSAQLALTGFPKDMKTDAVIIYTDYYKKVHFKVAS